MSFWKKFGKIAGIAGAGLATALTAGGASPLLAAAIGAGSGALSGGLNNGWKGALLGGATGALPGAIGKVAGGASKLASPSAGFLSKALGMYDKIKPYMDMGGQVAGVLGEPNQPQMRPQEQYRTPPFVPQRGAGPSPMSMNRMFQMGYNRGAY